jgi:hypothetical protein
VRCPADGSVSKALDASTLKEPKEYHYQRDGQENVNGSAECVRREHPE